MFTLYSSKISLGKPVHISGLEMIPKLGVFFFAFLCFPFSCPPQAGYQPNNTITAQVLKNRPAPIFGRLISMQQLSVVSLFETKEMWWLTALFWEASSLVIFSVHLSQCGFTPRISSSPGGCQLGEHLGLHQIPEEVVGCEVSYKINYSSICKESSVSKPTLKKGLLCQLAYFPHRILINRLTRIWISINLRLKNAGKAIRSNHKCQTGFLWFILHAKELEYSITKSDSAKVEEWRNWKL